jgi:hypothetical protein
MEDAEHCNDYSDLKPIPLTGILDLPSCLETHPHSVPASSEMHDRNSSCAKSTDSSIAVLVPLGRSLVVPSQPQPSLDTLQLSDLSAEPRNRCAVNCRNGVRLPRQIRYALQEFKV